MNADAEILVGMSEEELQALADGLLSPSAHRLLNDLLDRNRTGRLKDDEEAELDHLLAKVELLTILKTRARYTLQRM